MSEEIKREAELNEAALEGVSGGDSPNQMAGDACKRCPRRRKCSHLITDLADYLRKHPDVSVPNFPHCPFYDEAR